MTERKLSQFEPDWEQDYMGDFTVDLGVECVGGGFYLTATDTMLVTPVGVPFEQLWWHANKLPPDTVWHVMVWNSPYRETVWAWMGLIPTRLDTRYHEAPAMFQRVTRERAP